MKPAYWVGVITHCNLCEGALGSVMYDAREKWSGRWGNFCHSCFQAVGSGLGTGKGQKYAKQADGKWLKVEG